MRSIYYLIPIKVGLLERNDFKKKSLNYSLKLRPVKNKILANYS